MGTASANTETYQRIVADAFNWGCWSEHHHSTYTAHYIEAFDNNDCWREDLGSVFSRHDRILAAAICDGTLTHTHTCSVDSPLELVNHIEDGVVELVRAHQAPVRWCTPAQLNELAQVVDAGDRLNEGREVAAERRDQLDDTTWAALTCAGQLPQTVADICTSGNYSAQLHHTAAVWWITHQPSAVNTARFISALNDTDGGRQLIVELADIIACDLCDIDELSWLTTPDQQHTWTRVAYDCHGSLADAIDTVTRLHNTP